MEVHFGLILTRFIALSMKWEGTEWRISIGASESLLKGFMNFGFSFVDISFCFIRYDALSTGVGNRQ